MHALLMASFLCTVAGADSDENAPLPPIAADRELTVLTEADDPRAMLGQASALLADWTIDLAGVAINGEVLARIANTPADEPILRAAREELRRAVDLEDFVYFLDDVLAAEDRRGEPFFVGSGRARSVGILLHPDDVFRDRPRVYPHRTDEVAVDRSPPQSSFPRAEDGEVLGPNWTMRYRSPSSRHEMYTTLAEKRPESAFASRVAALVTQIERQGVDVVLTSFLRYRERGYLMWGAHVLRSCKSDSCAASAVKKLDAAKSWAKVDITWKHPDGWDATREAARQMADAFDVVYATERGARRSNHYDGEAADFVAQNLPRSLELWAPDGAHRVFDLSGEAETRDLSLTPELIAWVELHFGFEKLKSDYPHWNDTNR